MNKIKFGTDGWRAIIAKEFTVNNVARVAQATANWLKQQTPTSKVVIGYDCRFAGKLFVETVAKVLAINNVQVVLADNFVSTPILSLSVVKLKANLGIVITASHNPPEYNGFKLKGSYGGPLLPNDVEAIENLIDYNFQFDFDQYSLQSFIDKGQIKITNLEDIYVQHIEQNFDLNAIKQSGLNYAYDAMFGAGQNVMRRLLPDITFLHAEYNPSFEGVAPEPIMPNLSEFAEMIKLSDNIDCGLATDGDADRLGMFDSEGNFIDSHHLMLLLIHYLVKYKKLSGKVCTAFSSTNKLKDICRHYNLELEIVKIGFKYICDVMLKEDVLLGGEESGGIAIKGHLPERDGIWIGLTIWEYMAKSGKSLKELIAEVYDITGPFAFERIGLHLTNEQKTTILDNCKNNRYTQFGEHKVKRMETIDGFKYFFDNEEWLMIRASGTEPLLRIYSEAATRDKAIKYIEIAKQTLLGGV